MTVLSSISKVRYVGNGTTTDYDYPGRLFDEADIEVRLEDGAGASTLQTLSTHYTLTGVNSLYGGKVKFLSAPANGKNILIQVNTPLTQETAIRNQTSFFPSTHEDVFDRLTRQQHWLDRRINRSLRDNDYGTEPSMVLPTPQARAGYYLRFAPVTGAPEAATEITGNPLSQSIIGQFLYPQTTSEVSAAVTPTYYYYPEGNVKRYGAVGDGSTDDTLSVQKAFTVAAVAGGVVYFPAGDYKITSQLNSNQNALGVEGSLLVLGDGRRASKLISYLASGTMLYIGDGSGSVQYGVSIEDLGFTASASSAETNLVRMDYCLDGRVNNCLFDGGADTQLYLGRAQNVRVYGTEFRGDGASGTPRTDYGIKVDVSAGAAAGQGCKIIACTIRTFRSGDGIGCWFVNGGGGEHSIISCMIESSYIGVRVESSRHSVIDNSFENTVSTDIQLQIGKPAGVRAQKHVITHNDFSASSMLNFKCIDMQVYNDIKIFGNRFYNENGTHVYFGADENNSPSYFTGNECPMSAVSFGGTDGKVIVRDNSSNGTNNPRKTLADAETTPNVANYDIIATANTAPTTITNFLNGYPGKYLVVMAEDANTSIGSGSRIDTITGATIALANGECVAFIATVTSVSTDPLVWKQVPFGTTEGVLTPAQITVNTNDYAPASYDYTIKTLRLSTDASRNLTGLTGGKDGRMIRIFNVGSFDLVLTNADAASTTTNRFLLGANVTLNADEGITLWYDSTSNRWRSAGRHN